MHENINSRTQKEIKVKTHKGFNKVQLIMCISTNERESLNYYENQNTRLKYQSIVTTRKKKITKPYNTHNNEKIPHKTSNP